MGKRNVPRGKTARQKRTVARSKAVGVGKAQDLAASTEEFSTDDVVASVSEALASLSDEVGETLTASVVVWDEEEGFYDVVNDLSQALNPGDSWRWWVADVALTADRAILCDSETQEAWLAPFTIGEDREPVLAPQSEWQEVESAWVADDDGNLSVTLAGAPIKMTAGRTVPYTLKMRLEGIEFVNEADVPALIADAEATLATDTLPVELQPGETLPERAPSPEVSAPAVTTNDGSLRWNATICPEGVLTEDGRAFAPGAISWRTLPLSLMAQLATDDGHDGAIVSGRIDEIWREGDLLKASGVFDGGEFGTEIGRLVGEGTLRGVSVDLAVLQHEVGPRSDYFDEAGNWIHGQEVAATDDTEEEKSDGDALLDLLFGNEDAIFVVTEAKIGAVTVCSFPAFADASIQLAASLVAGAAPDVWTVRGQGGWTVVRQPGSDGGDGGAPGLTASAAGLAPAVPPFEWFADPALNEPTGLTVDEEGRIYGHAALWGTCHIGIPDVCTTAPHSNTGYAYFHLKEVATNKEGSQRVPVGTVTLETGHADRHLGRAAAAAHYDNTGFAVADVRVGEDDHGIWVAGALRPDVGEDKARDLRGAVLSGDWRDVNGNLELVALLAVNVPGFPVPRAPSALVASGDGEQRVVALVAAGINRDGAKATLSEDQLAELAALHVRAEAA